MKAERRQGGFILLWKVKEEQIVVDNGCFLSNPQIIYFVSMMKTYRRRYGTNTIFPFISLSFAEDRKGGAQIQEIALAYWRRKATQRVKLDKTTEPSLKERAKRKLHGNWTSGSYLILLKKDVSEMLLEARNAQ